MIHWTDIYFDDSLNVKLLIFSHILNIWKLMRTIWRDGIQLWSLKWVSRYENKKDEEEILWEAFILYQQSFSRKINSCKSKLILDNLWRFELSIEAKYLKLFWLKLKSGIISDRKTKIFQIQQNVFITLFCI